MIKFDNFDKSGFQEPVPAKNFVPGNGFSTYQNKHRLSLNSSGASRQQKITAQKQMNKT